MKEGDGIETGRGGQRCAEVPHDKNREEALARLRALRRPLPKGFKFDRSEANERQGIRATGGRPEEGG